MWAELFNRVLKVYEYIEFHSERGENFIQKEGEKKKELLKYLTPLRILHTL